MVTSPPYTYTHIHVVDREIAFFGAVEDKRARVDDDHAIVFRRRDGDWSQQPVDTAVCGSCKIPNERRLANVGVFGDVHIFEFPGESIEIIDDSDRGPSSLVPLRTVREIKGRLYVAGMRRMVYARFGNNDWRAIDSGVFASRDEDDAVGFLAIDGHDHNDLFAAGYGGEIWHFDGSDWTKQGSPTNILLTCMTVAGDGSIHVAGMAGLYLIGHRGSWTVVDHGLHEDDFWGVCEFNGKIYSSTNYGIFRYDSGQLEKVTLDLPDSTTTAYLDARGGVLWSAGYKDLARTKDGFAWELIDGPELLLSA